MQDSKLDCLRDTIFATATPPGKGAICMIRLSGEKTLEILEQVFLPAGPLNRPESHKACFGRIARPGSREILDESVAVFYKAPRSYTGQDMAEISIHGSPIIEAQFSEVLTRAGARSAQPGEFTFRAYLAGKMDLTQAEAVRDLIESQTDLQARLAREQLLGGIASALRPVRQALLELIAGLEATVEFSEEEALEGSARPRAGESLEEIMRDLSRLRDRARTSALARSGATVVIAGRPNAGKSSLFNRLVGAARAIVTEEPGTTRDLICERGEVLGLPVQLVDTAGIRTPAGPAEVIGIEKSVAAMKESDVLLLVIDASLPWAQSDWELLAQADAGKTVVALNKSDLPPRKLSEEIRASLPNLQIVNVSALAGRGVEELVDAAARVLAVRAGTATPDRAAAFHHRHEACIHAALLALEQGRTAIASSMSEEYLLYHLRQGLDHLDRITGASASDDLLDTLFSTFCIGK